jgi:hypothetical protein
VMDKGLVNICVLYRNMRIHAPNLGNTDLGAQ